MGGVASVDGIVEFTVGDAGAPATAEYNALGVVPARGKTVGFREFEFAEFVATLGATLVTLVCMVVGAGAIEVEGVETAVKSGAD